MALTLRGYARHRGMTLEAVRKAVNSGRISTVKGKIDPKKADRQWDANTDPTKGKGTRSNGHNGDGGDEAKGTMLRAQTKRAIYKAHAAELEYQEKVGKLVDAEEVQRAWAQIVTEFRAAVMAVPVKVRTRLSHLSAEDVGVIDELLRAALADLALKGERERQRAADQIES